MDNAIVSGLSDVALVAEVARLSAGERRATVSLIAHLGELDARRLYLGAGFSSMFTYCTQALRLSEGGAYNRIEVARATRRFPEVLGLLEDGALNLATVRLLAPHLTEGNHRDLLAAASGKTRRGVEELIAGRCPRPDVAASIRKLPASGATVCVVPEATAEVKPAAAVPSTASVGKWSVAPVPARVVTPLATDRYQIRFTASDATCEKLRRAQDLLRHSIPDGDPAKVFDRALTALLDDLTRGKFAATAKPRAGHAPREASRHIPAEVRRAVAARDGASCAFVSRSGRRCGERGFLEFHHLVPYALGGQATVGNIQLRCRAHNAYEAEHCFGPGRMGTPRPVPENRLLQQDARNELVPGRVRAKSRVLPHPASASPGWPGPASS